MSQQEAPSICSKVRHLPPFPEDLPLCEPTALVSKGPGCESSLFLLVSCSGSNLRWWQHMLVALLLSQLRTIAKAC